jgi:hypothetical protein
VVVVVEEGTVKVGQKMIVAELSSARENSLLYPLGLTKCGGISFANGMRRCRYNVPSSSKPHPSSATASPQSSTESSSSFVANSYAL